MTRITTADIKKIASLAKIELADDKKEGLIDQLSKIIAWVETLNEVNTDKIEPLNNVHNMALKLHEDKILQENQLEEILANAKAKYNYYTVPKVIE